MQYTRCLEWIDVPIAWPGAQTKPQFPLPKSMRRTRQSASRSSWTEQSKNKTVGMLQPLAHSTLLKYPLQVSDHAHTTERDTPYLHAEIPTTSQWSHTHTHTHTHTQQKEIHHTYMLKYPLQVSDHTHNRKRYTTPTCWNTHYKSVITYTTERDTPYLHAEIPTTSQWSHTQQKEIHYTYMPPIWHMCSEVSKLEQHDLQVRSQDWPKGGVLISNMGIRQGPLQNQGEASALLDTPGYVPGISTLGTKIM